MQLPIKLAVFHFLMLIPTALGKKKMQFVLYDIFFYYLLI